MIQKKKEDREIREAEPIETPSLAPSESAPDEGLDRDTLLKRLKEAQEASAGNYDLYLRAQAEIDNIRKRHKKDKEDWLKYSNEGLIKSLLPSLDNIEKALEHAGNSEAIHALREGIELTLKGLKESLSKSGLAEVRALGEVFDPCFHEAVSQIQDDSVKPGTILQELQRGYLLNGRLIRPAIVVVSRPGSSSPASDTQEACERI